MDSEQLPVKLKCSKGDTTTGSRKNGKVLYQNDIGAYCQFTVAIDDRNTCFTWFF